MVRLTPASSSFERLAIAETLGAWLVATVRVPPLVTPDLLVGARLTIPPPGAELVAPVPPAGAPAAVAAAAGAVGAFVSPGSAAVENGTTAAALNRNSRESEGSRADN